MSVMRRLLPPTWWRRLADVAQTLEAELLGWSVPPVSLAIGMTGWTPEPLEASCRRCGSCVGPGEGDETGCGACRRGEQPVLGDAVIRVGPYVPPLSNWVVAIKHQSWVSMAERLGGLLGERLLAGGVVRPGRTIVVPMPASPLRSFDRGIDHAAVIAAAVADTLGCPLVRLLRRSLSTAQADLPRAERLKRGTASLGLSLHRGWSSSRRCGPHWAAWTNPRALTLGDGVWASWTGKRLRRVADRVWDRRRTDSAGRVALSAEPESGPTSASVTPRASGGASTRPLSPRALEGGDMPVNDPIKKARTQPSTWSRCPTTEHPQCLAPDPSVEGPAAMRSDPPVEEPGRSSATPANPQDVSHSPSSPEPGETGAAVEQRDATATRQPARQPTRPPSTLATRVSPSRRSRLRWLDDGLTGATVVLVDDVRTTGASARAAIRLLRTLHPAAVVAAFLCCTPPDRPSRGLERGRTGGNGHP